MRIAFVIPPRMHWQRFVEAEDCCFRASKKRHLPAMLLACASQLDNAIFVDLSIDDPLVLREAKPDVIVYPVVWNHYQTIMSSMDKIASDWPRIILPMPPGYAQYIMERSPGTFCAVYSEPEAVLADLGRMDVRRLKRWRAMTQGIVWYDEKGELHDSGPLDNCLDKINGTNFELVPSHYWQYYKVVIYQVARGCPYRCKFCVWGGSTVTDRTFKMRPARQVVRDLWQMRYLANRALGRPQGYSDPITLYLLSAQLTTRLDWIKRFHIMMKGNPWPFQSPVNLFDITEEKLALLMQSGLSRTSAGLDACSDKMLRRLGKRHSFDQAIKGALILDQSSIPYTLHVRIGYGETPDDIREAATNLQRMYDAGVRRAQINFGHLVHFKGTQLAEYPPYPVELDPRHVVPVDRAVRQEGSELWDDIVTLAQQLWSIRQ
jgi:hypothetical protein